ncbi:MAG: DMT family transporter [Vibrio sp.]
MALIAFAANSVLTRLALADGNIDSLSFTLLRLSSGAVMLAVLLGTKFYFSKQNDANNRSLKNIGSGLSSIFLFVYALCFSIAYLTIDTGTGALILFGAVQITMIFNQLRQGNKLQLMEWIGVICAFSGFAYLVSPNISTPSFTGLVLMTVAGIAWAGYTIRGKQCDDPLKDTAGNFIRSLAFCLPVLVFIFFTQYSITPHGALLAITSGAITSGIGYAIWYVALRGLTATQAGVLQLLVPVIAALGGVIFVNERITFSFILSSGLILFGILMVILSKNKNHQ